MSHLTLQISGLCVVTTQDRERRLTPSFERRHSKNFFRVVCPADVHREPRELEGGVAAHLLRRAERLFEHFSGFGQALLAAEVAPVLAGNRSGYLRVPGTTGVRGRVV